jgi:hypothetical protein
MIVSEVLPWREGRYIIRAYVPNGTDHIYSEFLFRIPPVEYAPRSGDTLDFENHDEDRRVRFNLGPWIKITVNDYSVASGTCVGMPLTEAFRS